MPLLKFEQNFETRHLSGRCECHLRLQYQFIFCHFYRTVTIFAFANCSWRKCYWKFCFQSYFVKEWLRYLKKKLKYLIFQNLEKLKLVANCKFIILKYLSFDFFHSSLKWNHTSFCKSIVRSFAIFTWFKVHLKPGFRKKNSLKSSKLYSVKTTQVQTRSAYSSLKILSIKCPFPRFRYGELRMSSQVELNIDIFLVIPKDL